MERKTNIDGSKGQENSLEVGGGVVKGGVGERLWLVAIHTKFTLCCWGQDRTLPSWKPVWQGLLAGDACALITLSSTKVSQAEEASWTSWWFSLTSPPPPPLKSLSSFPEAESFWKRWQRFGKKEEFHCQWMQTIGLFVFEQGMTSARASWWTPVPVGAGPWEPRCHIKPLLTEDQRARHSCGTILVQTALCQLRWDMIKTALRVPHAKHLQVYLP